MPAFPPPAPELDPAWLSRPPLPRSLAREAQAVAGRTVLVTGAGGSIGQALCVRMLDADVAALIALEAAESHLCALSQHLERHPRAARAQLVLADVRDAAAMAGVLRRRAPQAIFHAAAFKHVPLLEAQPLAAVANNTLATCRLLGLSAEHGCGRFVQVSTDKAAAPVSILGASKRLAELAILGWDGSPTVATAVRLANVWASRGSVVPRLLERHHRGVPLHVTDPEARRFFLSHAEAVNAIVAALWWGAGNDVLVPELGRPLSVREVVARTLGHAAFQGSGLLPGERREEVLLGPADVVEETEAPWLHRVIGPRPDPASLAREIGELAALVERQDSHAATDRLWRALVALEASGAAGLERGVSRPA